MPVIGTFHTNYWSVTDTSGIGAVDSPWMYPFWQPGVILGMGLGPIGAWWDQQKAYWQLGKRIASLEPERRGIVAYALQTVEDEKFEWARMSVRHTAGLLGFNRPHTWGDLQHLLETDPGRQQNTFRHLEAERRYREAVRVHGSTSSNPDTALAVELAYQGFRKVGR